MLLALWRHRSFVLAGALHELKQRYAGSALGVLWHVVTPLAQILVYYAVFSRFMSARSDTPDRRRLRALPVRGHPALVRVRGVA